MNIICVVTEIVFCTRKIGTFFIEANEEKPHQPNNTVLMNCEFFTVRTRADAMEIYLESDRL